MKKYEYLPLYGDKQYMTYDYHEDLTQYNFNKKLIDSTPGYVFELGMKGKIIGDK